MFSLSIFFVGFGATMMLMNMFRGEKEIAIIGAIILAAGIIGFSVERTHQCQAPETATNTITAVEK